MMRKKQALCGTANGKDLETTTQLAWSPGMDAKTHNSKGDMGDEVGQENYQRLSNKLVEWVSGYNLRKERQELKTDKITGTQQNRWKK